MEAGGVPSAGNKRSSAASTATRSSSKNEGSFIAAEIGCAMRIAPRSRFVLFFRLERLRRQLSVRLLQQNLHAPFRFFQLLLAFARELHAFFEQFHGLVQRELWALEAPHHFFQPRQGLLKIRLLHRLRLLHRSRVHVLNLVLPESVLPIVSHVRE